MASVEKGHLLPPLFRAAWPRHTAKRAAQAAGVPVETARNWVRGRASPSAELLLRIADVSGGFAAALERLLDDRRAARMARPAGAGGGNPRPADGRAAATLGG